VDKVKLSCKGQLVLPKPIRDVHQWGVGTEFIVRDTGAVIVLEPVPRFAATQLEQSDTPSAYKGKKLTLEDMENAVKVEAGRHRK
jgi:bifunctional DNA-binding transcriptional regulator/antitoxin component of YhaV-PrlF toxin-antitoxin module